MIVFDLRCVKEHLFEAWFRDSASYEEQRCAEAVFCPVCGSTEIEKALMAPNLAGAKKKGEAPAIPGPAKMAMEGAKTAEVRQALRALRKVVEENCDNVGPGFAEEARKIHYGEADPRGIYGETTGEEARDLVEEGIEVKSIPWIPKEDS